MCVFCYTGDNTGNEASLSLSAVNVHPCYIYLALCVHAHAKHQHEISEGKYSA